MKTTEERSPGSDQPEAFSEEADLAELAMEIAEVCSDTQAARERAYYLQQLHENGQLVDGITDPLPELQANNRQLAVIGGERKELVREFRELRAKLRGEPLPVEYQQPDLQIIVRNLASHAVRVVHSRTLRGEIRMDIVPVVPAEAGVQ